MNTITFEILINAAYRGRDRDLLGIATNLQCESSELAELILKKKWYKKEYTDKSILSEAGDVLNFLTILLIRHNLSLNDAMSSNIKKLKRRGWLDEKI